MKALKVTVSGSYKTANGDIVDFENVSGVIPFVDEEHAKMHVRSRYASEWVRSETTDTDKKKYPQRIDQMRQVFIDDIQEVVHQFSFVGKNIKDMSYEELQDLATAKDLRTIPLPKNISGVDLREMRTKAYIEYSDKVNGNFIDVNDPLPQHASKVGDRLQFDFAKVPALHVDGQARIETAKKVTNEEMINNEMKPMLNNQTPKDNLSLDELKKIAKDKGVTHHWNIGKDKLYALLFGGN